MRKGLRTGTLIDDGIYCNMGTFSAFAKFFVKLSFLTP